LAARLTSIRRRPTIELRALPHGSAPMNPACQRGMCWSHLIGAVARGDGP
jgi:hypothetical protein